jgi:membrane protease YdiL (CAAX protease family)
MEPANRFAIGPLAAFFALAVALSWGWWGWMWHSGQVVRPGSGATHLPGLAGPMIAALIVSAAQRRGILGDLLRRGCRMPTLSPPLMAMAAVPLLALAVTAVMSRNPRALLDYPGLPAGLGPLAGVAVVVILGGFGEEFGWRGFAYDRLAALGRFRAALIVTALWGFWHLPLFFVHAAFGAMVGPLLIGWVAGLLAGSFVLAWLYERSDHNIALVAMWHVAFNYATGTPPMEGLESDDIRLTHSLSF